MADVTSPDILPTSKALSRRDFLKLSGAGILGLALSAFFRGEPYPPEFERWCKIFKNEITDVLEYRKVFGLAAFPKVIYENFIRGVRWEGEPPEFVNELTGKLQPFGESIREVLKIVFGPKIRHLIKGAVVEPESKYGASFNPNTRKVELPANFDINISVFNWLSCIFHEGGGHGTEVVLGTPHPPEVMIKVLHGMWRALSQAFSVEGQFLRHPMDSVYPATMMYLGEQLALLINDNKLSRGVDHQGSGKVRALVKEMMQGQNKTKETFKFTKEVCMALGEEAMRLLGEEKIQLEPGLQARYEARWEWALNEIYAEMMQRVFMKPQDLQGNTEIVAGIKEVVAAIRGVSVDEVDLDEIRRALPTPQVQAPSAPSPTPVASPTAKPVEFTPSGQPPATPGEMRETPVSPVVTPERPPVTQVPASTPEPKATPPVLTEEEQLERNFNDFIKYGRLPKEQQIFQPELEEAIRQFGQAVSEIIFRGPYWSLHNTSLITYDPAFDPKGLHIWETHEIERAINSAEIRGLLRDMNAADIEIIRKKTAALQRFISNTDAFGT